MRHIVLGLSLLLLSVPVVCQSVLPDTDENKIKKFLTEFVSKHNERARQQGGIGIEFTGAFEPLPAALEKSLSAAFPNHRFTAARMLYFHYTGSPVTLIIVTNSDSNKIVSYAWNLSFSGVSDSFRDILSFYPAKSKEDALSKVRILSELLVFAGNGKIGKVKSKKGTISAELYYSYAKDKKPWRILRVTVDKQFRFGRIALINTVSNKEGSEVSPLNVQ